MPVIDTDWAGCLRTRKSTSGGCVILGHSHVIKTWSSAQKHITLSSCEAELMGIAKGATEALDLNQKFEEWGHDRRVEVRTDSSAAIGT